MNSRAVTHCCTSTDWCWTPAKMLAPPPMETRENGTKTTIRAQYGLSRMACRGPGQGDAERREHKDDRHEGPLQYAHRDHEGRHHQRRRRAAPRPLHAFEAHQEQEPDGGRGHAVEGGLQPRHAGNPLVDRGQADDDEEWPD